MPTPRSGQHSNPCARFSDATAFSFLSSAHSCLADLPLQPQPGPEAGTQVESFHLLLGLPSCLGKEYVRVCQIEWAPNWGKHGVAVLVARGVTPAGVSSGLRQQAWLIGGRGVANKM